MREKTYISVNAAIKLIIWTGISIFLLAISFYLLDDIAKVGGDWLNTTISSLGNLSGGIIGGIVAYLVASFQIKKSNDIQDKLLKKETYTLLRLLKEEINYNKEVIHTILPYNQTANNYLEKHLQVIQWVSLSSKIGTEVGDNDFLDLCDFYRKINYIKSSSKYTDEALVKSTDELATKLLFSLQTKIEYIWKEINEN